MQKHNLKRRHPNKAARRVGRGGKRGKTSGRGHKGQKARAGRKLRPEMRDTIKKLPKKRGTGKNRARTVHSGRVVPIVVNLKVIDVAYTEGGSVSPKTLREKGLITVRKGTSRPVKILGTGEVTKKLSFERCLVSGSAREKIEKAGGTI